LQEVYYVEDEEWDYYIPSEILEQQSTIEHLLYSGDLLVSELVKQQEKMYCLATSYLLIADIDCGDRVAQALSILSNYVNQNGGCFRTYKTKNGMRYLQTDIAYQGANRSAIKVLKALGSDPQYIHLCDVGKRFMARLTPKIDPIAALQYFDDLKQGKHPEMKVCDYLGTVGRRSTMPMLRTSIELHDFVTQITLENLPLS
jgi:hypothetical protein